MTVMITINFNQNLCIIPYIGLFDGEFLTV